MGDKDYIKAKQQECVNKLKLPCTTMKNYDTGSKWAKVLDIKTHYNCDSNAYVGTVRTKVSFLYNVFSYTSYSMENFKLGIIVDTGKNPENNIIIVDKRPMNMQLRLTFDETTETASLWVKPNYYETVYFQMLQGSHKCITEYYNAPFTTIEGDLPNKINVTLDENLQKYQEINLYNVLNETKAAPLRVSRGFDKADEDDKPYIEKLTSNYYVNSSGNAIITNAYLDDRNNLDSASKIEIAPTKTIIHSPVGGGLYPSRDGSLSLGSEEYKWKSLYISQELRLPISANQPIEEPKNGNTYFNSKANRLETYKDGKWYSNGKDVEEPEMVFDRAEIYNTVKPSNIAPISCSRNVDDVKKSAHLYLSNTGDTILTASSEGANYLPNTRLQLGQADITVYLPSGGNILPNNDGSYSLGSMDKKFKALYLSETLRIPIGGTFPAEPVNGQKFFHTGLKKEVIYYESKWYSNGEEVTV